MKKLLVTILICLMLGACAHAFTDPIRKQAENDVPFVDVMLNLKSNIGYTFIWGGTIANVTSTATGSAIEVIQTPLNKNGKIYDATISQGRFIILDPLKVDAELYFPGQTLSVVGVLTHTQHGTVEGKPYTFPILETIDIRLWGSKEQSAPVKPADPAI